MCLYTLYKYIYIYIYNSFILNLYLVILYKVDLLVFKNHEMRCYN